MKRGSDVWWCSFWKISECEVDSWGFGDSSSCHLLEAEQGLIHEETVQEDIESKFDQEMIDLEEIEIEYRARLLVLKASLDAEFDE